VYGVIIMKKRYYFIALSLIVLTGFMAFFAGQIQERKKTKKAILKEICFHSLLALELEQASKKPNEVNRLNRNSWLVFYDVELDKSASMCAEMVINNPSLGDDGIYGLLSHWQKYRKEFKRMSGYSESKKELGLNLSSKEIEEKIQKALGIMKSRGLDGRGTKGVTNYFDSCY